MCAARRPPAPYAHHAHRAVLADSAAASGQIIDDEPLPDLNASAEAAAADVAGVADEVDEDLEAAAAPAAEEGGEGGGEGEQPGMDTGEEVRPGSTVTFEADAGGLDSLVPPLVLPAAEVEEEELDDEPLPTLEKYAAKRIKVSGDRPYCCGTLFVFALLRVPVEVRGVAAGSERGSTGPLALALERGGRLQPFVAPHRTSTSCRRSRRRTMTTISRHCGRRRFGARLPMAGGSGSRLGWAGRRRALNGRQGEVPARPR